MRGRIVSCLLFCALLVAASHGADLESARTLYLSGDLDGARAELDELLASDEAGDQRPAALELLGRIAVDRKEWLEALEAWGELTNLHALSPEAAVVSAAIRPLQALADCDCTTELEPTPQVVAQSPQPAQAPTVESAPLPPAEPPAEPVDTPAPQVADGTLILGGWGAEYDASQEATARLADFLKANGVAVSAASTEVPAIRGQDVVLSYLVEEARESGAAGVLFVTTRFNFREFIQIERFDVNGVRVWKERLIGGTALKERRDRDKPSWGLVERMEEKLGKMVGTAALR